MNREKAYLLAVSLIAVVAGVLLFRSIQHQPEFSSARQPEIPFNSSQKPALSYPKIRLKDLSNRTRALAEWGKPVQVINLWAPWCAPCRREIPILIELQQTFANDVQFIGLSFDSTANVVEFNKTMAINYPLLMVQSESTDINRFFGNQSGGLPFTVILNSKRDIIYRHAGEITKQQLEIQIKALL